MGTAKDNVIYAHLWHAHNSARPEQIKNPLRWMQKHAADITEIHVANTTSTTHGQIWVTVYTTENFLGERNTHLIFNCRVARLFAIWLNKQARLYNTPLYWFSLQTTCGHKLTYPPKTFENSPSTEDKRY